MRLTRKYKAIVIGTSAGGVDAFKRLIQQIGTELNLPVIVVQHLRKGTSLAGLMAEMTGLKVKEAEPGEPILPGIIYFAPADYHTAVEWDRTITLLSSEPINFSRPSIDVLFESAAEVYGKELIGVILTGSNDDGSVGLAKVKIHGGCTVVQSPDEAEYDTMPLEAINKTKPDFVGSVDEIAGFIKEKMLESA